MARDESSRPFLRLADRGWTLESRTALVVIPPTVIVVVAAYALFSGLLGLSDNWATVLSVLAGSPGAIGQRLWLRRIRQRPGPSLARMGEALRPGQHGD